MIFIRELSPAEIEARVAALAHATNAASQASSIIPSTSETKPRETKPSPRSETKPKGGRPRNANPEPWKAAGMSKASWYRRQKKASAS